MHRLCAQFLALILLLAAGCHADPDYALGTLERDRVTLPAPVSERIAEIAVQEGQTVAAGDLLLVLEPERSAARSDAAAADLARATAALAEARTGPRTEQIAAARARLAGAEGNALNARLDLARIEPLVAENALARVTLDSARARVTTTAADASAAREALAELENGTRSEEVEQAEAAVASARAALDSLQVDLARTRISAPRDGLVDSLPYEVGDQVPVGTPLAILLVGERAYARVYVPEPLRARIAIGTAATVRLHDSDVAYAGHVRAIRHEPAFTPYYALAGEDASRLSWLAEIELDAAADALPVGLPLRAEFDLAPAAARTDSP